MNAFAMPPLHYDMDGEPIDVLTWAALYENFRGRVLAEDIHDGKVIRTVWHGTPDEPWGTPRRIFGTALMGPEGGMIAELGEYATKEEALAGHARHLAALREGTT